MVIPGRESICPTEAQVSFSTTDAYSYGFLTQVASWAPAISYHANGLWSTIQHGNGVTDAQYLTPKATGGALDHRPRPRLLKTTAGATTLWSSGSFVYDFAGNVTALGEPDAGVGELNHLGGVDRFLYDRVQRLRQGWLTVPEGPAYSCLFCDEFETSDVCEWDVSEPPSGCLGKPGWPPTPESALFADRTQAYGFDVYGNIQSITTDGVAVTTTADPATNRLTGTGTGCDDRGNLAQRAGVTFSYDALNRMTKRVASGETSEYDFLYTADDERILTFVDRPAGDEFRWSLRDFGGKVLRDYVSTANGLRPATDYVFRGASLLGARDYQSDPDGVLDLHYTLDHLGTPRLITNPAGAVVDERKYFPFGEEARAADAEGPRLRFTGHERDVFNPGGAADDLDYLHARFYSPLTARFLSIDPAGADPLKPQGLNRYAYALNNPLRFIDESGQTPLAVVGLAVGGLAGGIGSIAVQMIAEGQVNWQDVGAATVGGAVSGGLAGATLGLSALAGAGVGTVALVTGGANVIGEGVGRSLDSSPESTALDPGAMVVDFAAGTAGGALGAKAAAATQMKAAHAAVQAEASTLAARRGSFGAAQSVAGHRSALASLSARAPIQSAIVGARASNIAIPAGVAALKPAHTPTPVTQDQFDQLSGD